MHYFRHRTLVSILSITLCLALTQFATAQRGGGRRGGMFGGVSRVQLATLEKVHAELKMTDEQKELAKEISEKLSEDRRGLFQGGGGGGGDFTAMFEKMEKMNVAASMKLTDKLDDAQKKRLTEIYVQLNGTSALIDKEVGTALKVTEDQQKSLSEANDKNREARMAAFRGFRDMSEEERTEASEKLGKESDGRLMAVLSAEQRVQFGKMKGKEIEIDMSQLFQRRGGGRGQGGGGRQGGGGAGRPSRPQ